MRKDLCRYKENDVDEIIPGLFLGNHKVSENNNFLINNKIINVIRLMETKYFNLNDYSNLKKTKFGYIYTKNNGLNNVYYYHFPIKDSDMCLKDLKTLFNITNNIILNSYLNNVNILIHCKNGHHRSASVVGAFLIKYLDLDYVTSIAYINSFRKCALRRENCMVRGLFKYYLNLHKKNCDEIKCDKQNNYMLCHC